MEKKEGVMRTERTDCGAMLKQISDIMEKNANNALRDQDLTLTQAGMLVELDRIPSHAASFKELERFFGVSQPTIVGIIKRLEQKKLVETQNDPADKRIRIAHLTEAGHEKCRSGYQHMEEAEKKLLSALTAEERIQFARLLEKIRQSIQ